MSDWEKAPDEVPKPQSDLLVSVAGMLRRVDAFLDGIYFRMAAKPQNASIVLSVLADFASYYREQCEIYISRKLAKEKKIDKKVAEEVYALIAKLCLKPGFLGGFTFFGA